MTAGRRLILFVAAAALVAASAWTADAKPRRVVSLNVCTDQLVLLLAERSRIASVSFLARDPAASAMAAAARGLAVNHGLAEEVLPLDPDLVLAGRAAARPTVALLRRLGYRVVELPLAAALGDVPRHIATVAHALGERARGAALVARFEARLARLTRAVPGDGPRALLLRPNGFSAGSASLPGSVIAAAGFRNIADGLGLAGIGRLALERVLAARPQAVILGRLAVESASLAAGVLDHRAVRRLVARVPVLHIPHHVWTCPTPRILDALEALVGLRSALSRAGAREGQP